MSDEKKEMSAEDKKKRITPVEFTYKDGPKVTLNQAAAEILEKRGDGKIGGVVKREAPKKADKKADKNADKNADK